MQIRKATYEDLDNDLIIKALKNMRSAKKPNAQYLTNSKSIS